MKKKIRVIKEYDIVVSDNDSGFCGGGCRFFKRYNKLNMYCKENDELLNKEYGEWRRTSRCKKIEVAND